MFPPIPSDITVAIIDQVADDPRSLRNLALTCHAFLPRSRYHLLTWHVSLRSPKMLCDFCYHLDANPDLRPFVRYVTLGARLEVNEEPCWRQALRSMIPTHLLKLPNLRHWKLQYFREREFSPCLYRLQSDRLRGDSVTNLVICETIFLHLTEFALFLCAFPGLRSLKVSWVDFERDETEVAFMPARDRLAKQLRLTSLETGEFVNPSLMTLFLEICQSTIEHLVFLDPGGDRIHALVRGTSALPLRSITVSQDSFLNMNMTSLMVHTWELIKGLPSSPPRNHTIGVYSLSYLHLAMDEEPLVNICRELEQFFTRQRLHNIVFRGRGVKLRRETFWTTTLSKHFSQLHGEGRLTVEGDKSSDAYYMAGHDATVLCLAVSPDNKWVASGSADRTIIVWNAQRGNIILQWIAHNRSVHDLAFSPDSHFLMSGGENHSVTIWDVEGGGAQIATLERHNMFACAWSPDGTLLASGEQDGTVRVWDAKSFAQLHCFQNVNVVRFSSDGRWLGFSPDGRWLAFMEENNCCNIWDTINCRSHKTLHADTHLIGRASAFDPSSKRIAVAANDYTIHLCDVETAEVLFVLRGHKHWIWDVSFSPNGDWLLSASWDGTAKIWDTYTGDMILSLEGHTDVVGAACFSPNGEYVASASYDKTVRLWRTSDGSCVRTFTEHTDWVQYVLFSPDGEALCSGASDGTVVIRCLLDIVPTDYSVFEPCV